MKGSVFDPKVVLIYTMKLVLETKELQLASCLSCCFRENIPDAVSLPCFLRVARSGLFYSMFKWKLGSQL